MARQFKKVAVGGTFDELHSGHKALLQKAFEVGDHVFIGLSADEFIRSMSKPHKTASYDQRLTELKSFLRKRRVLQRAEIMPLNDVYGITLSDHGVEALVVSKETKQTALEINEKRKEIDLPPLQIIPINMIDAENHSPISTTLIRRGEIDREGHLLKTCSKWFKLSMKQCSLSRCIRV